MKYDSVILRMAARGTTAQEVRDKLQVPIYHACIILSRMVEKKLIVREGTRRNYTYRLPEE